MRKGMERCDANETWLCLVLEEGLGGKVDETKMEDGSSTIAACEAKQSKLPCLFQSVFGSREKPRVGQGIAATSSNRWHSLRPRG